MLLGPPQLRAQASDLVPAIYIFVIHYPPDTLHVFHLLSINIIYTFLTRLSLTTEGSLVRILSPYDISYQSTRVTSFLSIVMLSASNPELRGPPIRGPRSGHLYISYTLLLIRSIYHFFCH
jgi:hypothetical protein